MRNVAIQRIRHCCPLKVVTTICQRPFASQMVANVTQKLKDVFRGFEEQPDIYIRMLDQAELRPVG